MVRLFILAPISSSDKIEEKRRKQLVQEFFFSDETMSKLKALGVDVDSNDGYNPDFPETSGDFCEGIRLVSGQNGQERKLIGKGDLVTSKMDRIKKYLYAQRIPLNECLFVLIDGSGKIDFKYALDVVEQLVKGNDVVLAYRGSDYNLAGEREIVERFENSLVEDKFSVFLPDCQCGCWGFNYKALQNNNPCCNGYEIELDMAIEYLKSKNFINFIHVKAEQGVSDFNEAAHAGKLFFLITKLKYTKDTVLTKARRFEVDGKKLPQKYITMIETLDWPQIEEQEKNQYFPLFPGKRIIPACFKRCEKPCNCNNKPVFI